MKNNHTVESESALKQIEMQSEIKKVQILETKVTYSLKKEPQNAT